MVSRRGREVRAPLADVPGALAACLSKASSHAEGEIRALPMSPWIACAGAWAKLRRRSTNASSARHLRRYRRRSRPVLWSAHCPMADAGRPLRRDSVLDIRAVALVRFGSKTVSGCSRDGCVEVRARPKAVRPRLARFRPDQRGGAGRSDGARTCSDRLLCEQGKRAAKRAGRKKGRARRAPDLKEREVVDWVHFLRRSPEIHGRARRPDRGPDPDEIGAAAVPRS